MAVDVFLSWAILFIIGAMFLVIVVYASARAAAVGWYRTKLEHLKRVMHITRGDD